MRLARELEREPRLADARLAGEQHEPARVVQLHARPGGAHAAELGRAPDELALVRPAQRGRRRHVERGRALLLVLPDLRGQRARRRRRRDPQRRPQPLGEPVVRGQRGRALARAREALDQAPVRLLAERVQRDRRAGPPQRLGEFARPLGVGGERLERRAEPVGVLLPGVVHPVVVEPGQQLARAGIDRLARAAGGEQRGERAHVDPQDLLVARERDRVARRHEAGGARAERRAQLAERDAQARPRALVEHVGPEAAGDLPPRVLARMQREPCEQQPRTARAGRRQREPAGFELQAAAEADAQLGR